MSDRYDAIIIGAGHNGLVAGGYLAKAGLKVLILERRGTLGGAVATEEIFPGYRFNTGADDLGMLLPEIIDDLQLRKWGLQFLESPVAMTALNPAGRALVVWRDPEAARSEITQASAADGEKYPDFLAAISRYTALLEQAMERTPPDIGKGLRSGEAIPWVSPALRLRRLGGDEMVAFLRLLPMSVSAFLAEWFESDLLLGALSLLAVRGAFQGPMASGTAYQFLYNARASGLLAGEDRRFSLGGAGALASALSKAAQSYRAEIRAGAEVSRILLREGIVAGVRLLTGEEIPGRMVISTATPELTYLQLVGPEQLPLKVVRRVKNIRYRGSTAKVNLALSGLPGFVGISSIDELKGRIVLSPGVEALERAYDAAKYGGIFARPALDLVIPTLLDPGLAPPGGQILCVSVRYTPYHLKDGSWDDRREALGDLVVDTLSALAPELPGMVQDRQVLTPLDLEEEYGLTGGSIYHGQMALDQSLFMRPIPGYGRYRTPVDGLYLCGAGAHPGGGVTGAPGYNAAREIFTDWRGI